MAHGMAVDAEALMAIALEEALLALDHDDVPVGAVVARADTGAVVARRHNEREHLQDPTAHAEVLALRDAAAVTGSRRLDDYVLVVTLEPCPMCAGAAMAARVPLVVYGAADPKAGALGTLYHFGSDPRLHHTMRIRSGVCADAASELLVRFFAERRDATTRDRPGPPP